VEIKLLYVEDEDNIREFLLRILKRRFKNIEYAVDGEDGLKKFFDFKPDIVVTDIRMPNMNGIDMSRKIKEFDKNVQIIITTAHNEIDVLAEAIEIGVNHFVIKPVNTDKIMHALSQSMRTVMLDNELKKQTSFLTEYKNAIDASSIVSKTDRNGIITYINKRFEEISEYSYDEVVGKPHSIVRHPDMPKEAFAELWMTIKNKQIWRGTIRNLSKNGKTYIVDSTVVPILNDSGEIEEFIGIRHDITELEHYKTTLEKRIEEEVADNRKKDIILQQQSAQAAMGEMVNSIAHQWRQPLNSIALIASNIAIDIELGEDTDTTLESINKITNLTKTMSQTITDFMEFFNPNRQKSYFQVHTIYDTVRSLLESQIFKKNITFVCEMDSSLGINSYKSDIQQISINIVNNAIQAFDDKVQDKKILKIVAYENDKYLVLEFIDNAGGIKDEILDKIFEPYFTTKPKGVGTGIGLSMVRNMVISLNGQIRAYNNDNGAVFEIQIPK
jgi:PAS domain S-box-containing protein